MTPIDTNRVLLHVKRVRQFPSECAIAAATAIAKYYDDSITYSQVRKMVPNNDRKSGLYTAQQARLLNDLGFSKLTIVTSDELLVDFSWSSLGKEDLVKKLKHKKTFCKRTKNKDMADYAGDLITWLTDERFDNNLVIDYDFPKYIKSQIDHGHPVGAGFNWTKVWKMAKWGEKGKKDDIRGEAEQHAVVIRGYDDSGIFVVDSHHKYYRGKLEKYKNGYYKIPWAKYLVSAPDGDLILAQ